MIYLVVVSILLAFVAGWHLGSIRTNMVLWHDLSDYLSEFGEEEGTANYLFKKMFKRMGG